MTELKVKAILSILIFFFISSFFLQIVDADILDDQFASDIVKYMNERDPQKRLKLFEELLSESNPYQQYIILPKLSKTAIEVSEFSKAKNYANQLLRIADGYRNDWNYGNAIHDANIALGMVSLNNNSGEEAKEYLLKAGHAPASPQLKTFGPSMILADALLKKGETEVVIEYLQLIKKVWEHDDGRIDSWISAIKGGGMPYFGENLLY